VPRVEVDRVLTDAFDAYEVWYLFGDPYRWQEYFDVWAARWPKRVVEFPTNVEKRMDDAIVRFQTVLARELTHDGDETLTAHVMQAAIARGRKRAPRPEEDPAVAHHYLRVIPKRDKGHIDALVAGLLAEAARGQAIEDGALNAPPPAPPPMVAILDAKDRYVNTSDLMTAGF